MYSRVHQIFKLVGGSLYRIISILYRPKIQRIVFFKGE
jgi:hypothetical protein